MPRYGHLTFMHRLTLMGVKELNREKGLIPETYLLLPTNLKITPTDHTYRLPECVMQMSKLEEC